MTPEPEPTLGALFATTGAEGAPLPSGEGAGGLGASAPTEVLPLRTNVSEQKPTGAEECSDEADLAEWMETRRERHRHVTLFCANCGGLKSIPVYCRNRFCPVCGGKRKYRIRDRLNFLIDLSKPSHSRRLKMVTLTQRHSPTIWEGMKAITHSFKRLRASAFWKIGVEGGAWVVEVTGAAGAWHIHIHALVVGKYLDRERLTAEWAKVANGNITHVMQIPGEKAINYITKYVTKPGVNSKQIDEVAQALSGARLFSTFGAWHNVALPKRPSICHCPTCQGTEWHMIGGWSGDRYGDDELWAAHLRADWLALGHSPPQGRVLDDCLD